MSSHEPGGFDIFPKELATRCGLDGREKQEGPQGFAQPRRRERTGESFLPSITVFSEYQRLWAGATEVGGAGFRAWRDFSLVRLKSQGTVLSWKNLQRLRQCVF